LMRRSSRSPPACSATPLPATRLGPSRRPCAAALRLAQRRQSMATRAGSGSPASGAPGQRRHRGLRVERRGLIALRRSTSLAIGLRRPPLPMPAALPIQPHCAALPPGASLPRGPAGAVVRLPPDPPSPTLKNAGRTGRVFALIRSWVIPSGCQLKLRPRVTLRRNLADTALLAQGSLMQA
jgi:hypothetical protein